MLLIVTIMILSISFQLVAAVIAINLIKTTKKKVVWFFISAAIFLMVLRRSISLFDYIYFNNLTNLIPEVIALITSIFLMIGIFGIKHLFLELKTKENEISLRNSELEGLSYRITHDLRNPLINIKGFIDLITDTTDYKKITEYIPKINNNISKMEYLISDLLKFIKYGKISFEKTNVFINDLFNELKSNYSTILEKHNIELIIEIKDNPSVYCNYHSFYEALENILSNSIKYMDNSNIKTIYLSSYIEKNTVLIRIKDTGLGICKGEEKNIFEPFYRVKNEKNIQGTGLGLAITKQIIDSHKGAIWVETTPLGGSTFIISLPKL